jgi:hypothetical protein
MRRPGYRPERRNRNSGTKARGHGANNRLKIPQRRWESYERFTDPVILEVPVGDVPLTFVVERTRADSVHACTVDDVVRVLQQLEPDDIAGLDTVIFRQSSRKSQILRPAWGWWSYYSRIVLEAVTATTPLRWSRKLDPFWRTELDRYRRAGIAVREHRRGFEMNLDVADVREVLLYRTLLHEVGHHVDYLENVERPSDGANAPTWSELRDRWSASPSVERETFAHRWADEAGARLRSQGAIPFARLDPPERLRELGLRVDDFHFATEAGPTERNG